MYVGLGFCVGESNFLSSRPEYFYMVKRNNTFKIETVLLVKKSLKCVIVEKEIRVNEVKREFTESACKKFVLVKTS